MSEPAQVPATTPAEKPAAVREDKPSNVEKQDQRTAPETPQSSEPAPVDMDGWGAVDDDGWDIGGTDGRQDEQTTVTEQEKPADHTDVPPSIDAADRSNESNPWGLPESDDDGLGDGWDMPDDGPAQEATNGPQKTRTGVDEPTAPSSDTEASTATCTDVSPSTAPGDDGDSDDDWGPAGETDDALAGWDDMPTQSGVDATPQADTDDREDRLRTVDAWGEPSDEEDDALSDDWTVGAGASDEPRMDDGAQDDLSSGADQRGDKPTEEHGSGPAGNTSSESSEDATASPWSDDSSASESNPAGDTTSDVTGAPSEDVTGASAVNPTNVPSGKDTSAGSNDLWDDWDTGGSSTGVDDGWGDEDDTPSSTGAEPESSAPSRKRTPPFPDDDTSVDTESRKAGNSSKDTNPWGDMGGFDSGDDDFLGLSDTKTGGQSEDMWSVEPSEVDGVTSRNDIDVDSDWDDDDEPDEPSPVESEDHPVKRGGGSRKNASAQKPRKKRRQDDDDDWDEEEDDDDDPEEYEDDDDDDRPPILDILQDLPWKLIAIIVAIVILLAGGIGGGVAVWHWHQNQIALQQKQEADRKAAQELADAKDAYTSLQSKGKGLADEVAKSAVKDDETVKTDLDALNKQLKKTVPDDTHELSVETATLQSYVSKLQQDYDKALDGSTTELQKTVKDLIDQANTLGDAPDGDDKTNMQKLATELGGTSVSKDNSTDVTKKADKLRDLIDKVSKAKADKQAADDAAKKAADDAAAQKAAEEAAAAQKAAEEEAARKAAAAKKPTYTPTRKSTPTPTYRPTTQAPAPAPAPTTQAPSGNVGGNVG